MSDGTRFQEARAWSGSIVLGLLVIILYGVLVISVFTCFASYILRSDWEARVSGSGNATEAAELDSLFFMVAREQVLKKQIETLLVEVQKVDELIDAAQQRLITIGAERVRAAAMAEQSARDVVLFLRRVEDRLDPASARALMAHAGNTELTVIAQADRIVIEFPAARFVADVTGDQVAGITSEFQQVSAILTEAKNRLGGLDFDRTDAENDRDRQLQARSWPRRKVQDAEDELRQLQDQMPPNSVHRAREAALDSIFFGIPRALVSYPTIFLTLLATIAAGGLGAVVAFSRSFFSTTPTASTARLFVSVGEGIAAALAVFLFSGAGMLVLTQGGGPDSQVELSPYTVAFVAFVSGFMAEHAFGSIQRWGERLFGANGDNGAGADNGYPAAPAPRPEPDGI